MAVGVESGGNRALTAEHVFAAEFRVKHVEVAHAIEHRHDRSLRSDRWRKRLDGIVEVEGLAAQQHDIERLLDILGQHGRRLRQGDVAMRTLDDKAVARQFFGTARPHQKRDVGAALQQPAAEIAADRAGSNHENAHGFGLVLFLVQANGLSE